MAASDAAGSDVPVVRGDDHCITCGDVALPMRVVRVDPGRGLALCETDEGERETVEIALVSAVGAGDRLLVHAGAALARLETD